MPQILGKDNSKFEQTISSQAETEYYKSYANDIIEKVRRINRAVETYGIGHGRESRNARKIAYPSQEDINNIMYEFSNDMIPNELLIIITVCINIGHRLLTDKEIYQIAKTYEIIEKSGIRRKH